MMLSNEWDFVREYDQIYGRSFKSSEMQCQMTLAKIKTLYHLFTVLEAEFELINEVN